jgi:hypothetical protein
MPYIALPFAPSAFVFLTRVALFRCVLLDVFAELQIQVERLVDAGVEHLQPVAGGLFEIGHVQQVAGLHDDLERVREIVGEATHFESELFGNLLPGGRQVGARRVCVGGLTHGWHPAPGRVLAIGRRSEVVRFAKCIAV